jgi:protein gp37
MPDGSIAECYAKTIADKFRSPKFMPDGFETHYFNPDRLNEPLNLKKPSRIFLDSFSDLMGHWVLDAQIEAVLDVCRRAHWHTFQLLTKNAPRLKEFDFPKNVWLGVSAPPSSMFGKALALAQQERMVVRQLTTLFHKPDNITWMSIEPLSFDIAPLLEGEQNALDWLVIGAASNGPKVYQPEPAWLENVLAWADKHSKPVFFKGNLRNCPAANPWREEFPTTLDAPDIAKEMP